MKDLKIVKIGLILEPKQSKMMKAEEYPKPCLHCGGKAKLIYTHTLDEISVCRIQCEECKIRTIEYYATDEDSCVLAWNSRV